MSQTMSQTISQTVNPTTGTTELETERQPIQVERQISSARLNELGVHGWPTWKDGIGNRQLDYDTVEKSYFLAGSATLNMMDGASINVEKGDLVIIPAGKCQWIVHQQVRRHYRSDALSPACCII